jgi:hypothetical protein
MDIFEKINLELKTSVLPLSLINSVLEDKSEDARKALLKRACQKGDLIRVRNGLYLLGEKKRKTSISLFEIANFIIEPSYVSLESALSHYGLIPEAVYTTTSVTTKSSLEQKTPVGQFSFSYLKTEYFNFGFYRIKDGDQKYLIATPLKALIDYIVLMKKHYKTVEEIEEDLRFDFDEFINYKKFVNKEKINEMLTVYKSYRIQVILKDIRKRL